MGKFTKTHNVVNRPKGSWRSIHGYGASQIANGRLLLCGYDVSLHLWRDAKYDGILECNGIPFRIEVKSTGLFTDPELNENQEISFTSGGRSGKQIKKNAPSREKILKKDDVDFAVGINSHDGTLWVIPVEILSIINRKKIKCKYSEIYREKISIFKGIKNSKFSTEMIKKGFFNYTPSELEKICKENSIIISNKNKKKKYKFQWNVSKKINSIIVDYKQSLIMDIWKFILIKC